MAPAPVHVELVHDPHRHRAVIGFTADALVLKVTARRLLAEAEDRAAQFAGINDLAAAEWCAEAERLRKVLAVVMPEEEPA